MLGDDGLSYAAYRGEREPASPYRKERYAMSRDTLSSGCVSQTRLMMLGRTIGIFMFEASIRHASTERSLNIKANWVFASNHSRGGRFHSAAAWVQQQI